MGTRVAIGSETYEAAEFTVTEDSSPLAGGDTSGGVGDINLSFPFPQHNPDHDLAKFGAAWLIDQEIVIKDTRYGTTRGDITGASTSGGLVNVTAVSRLAKLNVYNVKANPYIGTLGGAFQYYLSLAGITTGFTVDASITSRSVVLRGFTGELWFYLKQLAASQNCDISLVAGTIVLRPIRVRTAEKGRFVEESPNTGPSNLAQSVEIYWYSTTQITNGLVYPPGGWTPEVEVLNVNAGETTEYQLELSASVSSIQQPTASISVAPDYSATSIYTVVADDGLPVPTALWAANGGTLTVRVNPDTTSLTVTLTGASNIPTINGTYSKAFSIALASGTSGSRYSTLRIVGTGVSYAREKKVFRTGVPASKTSNEVGETVDNVFITNIRDLYRIGLRTAARYSGLTPTLSGSVTAINRRGETGGTSNPSYADVQSALELELGGSVTYAGVQTEYVTTESLTDYASVYDYWFATVSSDFMNQAFGNVNGARIKDPISKRWYRIRQGNITPGTISFSADDDLTFNDRKSTYTGQTYGDLQTMRDALTYQQDRMVGLIG